jgi:nucleotide-binding universal stress UspA family protein
LEEKGREADAQKELAKMADQELVREVNGGVIVVRGGPPYEIDRAAERLGVDLIVTGTHGYAGVEYFAFGSTAEAIVHNASCPVLTIRLPLVPVRFPDSDECAFKRILVPVSLTARSGGALGYAAALARRCDGEVILLYAARAGGGRSFARRQAIAPGRQLEILRERLMSAGIKASLEVCCGKPPLEIADCARRQKADLIVVNSHSQAGLWTHFARSTAERVVRRATCPVLVVRERTLNVPRKDESMAKAA